MSAPPDDRASSIGHADVPQPVSQSIDHDRLIQEFVHGEGTLFDLAAAHGMTIVELIEWYESEPTQQHLIALEQMADTRSRLLARSCSPEALECLAKIATDTADANPVECRRAASVILRHAGAPSGRAPARSRDSSVPAPSPRTFPDNFLHQRCRDKWRNSCANEPRFHPSEPRREVAPANGQHPQHPPPASPGRD